MVAPTDEVEERIKRYYGTESSSMEDILKQLGETGELLAVRGTDEASKRWSGRERDANYPVCRSHPVQAIQTGRATFISTFENDSKSVIGWTGALRNGAASATSGVAGHFRVKVMANMNIAEPAAPGRPHPEKRGRPQRRPPRLDLADAIRRGVVPVLDRSTVNLDLEALGLPDYIYDYILEIINRPNGIFITGPTGSGKRRPFIPACAGSTPSIQSCSPRKNRSNMIWKECRSRSTKRSA